MCGSASGWPTAPVLPSTANSSHFRIAVLTAASWLLVKLPVRTTALHCLCAVFYRAAALSRCGCTSLMLDATPAFSENASAYQYQHQLSALAASPRELRRLINNTRRNCCIVAPAAAALLLLLLLLLLSSCGSFCCQQIERNLPPGCCLHLRETTEGRSMHGATQRSPVTSSWPATAHAAASLPRHRPPALRLHCRLRCRRCCHQRPLFLLAQPSHRADPPWRSWLLRSAFSLRMARRRGPAPPPRGANSMAPCTSVQRVPRVHA